MTLSGTLVFFTNWVKACHIGSPDWWVCSFETDVSGCTWAMTLVLGYPNVTAFLKALSLHQFCSTCTATNSQLHVVENSFMPTYVSPFNANTSVNWNAVSRQIWRGCHISVDSGELSQAPPKQSAVCSTSIIPAPPANCQFIWMASSSAWVPPNLSWGDSRPYAVLQRTLDKDCRQAEEPKQLVDETSRFHLGCQRQHSAVICSGALLLSSRVLRPSLVTLCSYKSGRCTVELYHVPHLWYPPFYTSPMASSALQHWTTSPMKEGCHWQAGGENRQTWQFANPAWYAQPSIATTDIQEAAVAGLATSWHQKSMEA